MIYRNSIGPKCAPDVILLNLAEDLTYALVKNFSTRFVF